MAISATTTANITEYAYNPIWYKIQSSNWSNRNFKYIIDIYATAVWPPSSYTRYKLPPSPDHSAYFSPARVLESFVKPVFTPTVIGFTASTNPYVLYSLSIGEEYDLSTGPIYTGTTIYSGLTNTGINIALNAVKQIEDDHNLFSRIYTTGNTSPYLLSEWHLGYAKKVRSNDYETMSIYWELDGFGEYTILTFDSGSTQIGEFRITTGFDPLIHYHTIGVGPKNLNYTSFDYITSTNLPILGSNVHTYQIYNSDTGSNKSNSYIFLYDRSECLLFTPVRIAWLNRWGSFDYYGFTMATRNFVSRKNNEWNKFMGYGSTRGDRGTYNLNTESKKTFTVTTDFILPNESTFLETLFTSPEIYRVYDNGTYIPIQMVDKEFETKGDSDSLITYTLTFENVYDVQLQRS